MNHGHEIAVAADDHLFEVLYDATATYLSWQGHESQFAAVLYSSMVAEALVKDIGEYPPVGHDYPRIGR
ncbi:hypothetical protein ACQEVX_24840 [Streptomyces syringium]